MRGLSRGAFEINSTPSVSRPIRRPPSLFLSSLPCSSVGLLVQLHPDHRASRTNEPTSGARFAAAAAFSSLLSHRPRRHARYGTARRLRRRELGTSGKKGIALGTKYLATQNSLVVLKSLRDDIFFPCFDLSDHENEGLRELVRGGPPSLD